MSYAGKGLVAQSVIRVARKSVNENYDCCMFFVGIGVNLHTHPAPTPTPPKKTGFGKVENQCTLPCNEKDNQSVSIYNHLGRHKVAAFYHPGNTLLEVARMDGESCEWCRQSCPRRWGSLEMCSRIGAIIESSAILYNSDNSQIE